MRKENLFLMALLLVLLPQAAVFSADDQIIAPGASWKNWPMDSVSPKGRPADAQGNVLFTDQNNNRIFKWGLDGKLSTFMEPSGRSNGMCFDRQGNLWACADEKNELWRIDPAGKITVVVKDYEGKKLNGPNDVWIRADGGRVFHRSLVSQTVVAEREGGTGERGHILSSARWEKTHLRGRRSEKAQRDHRHSGRQNALHLPISGPIKPINTTSSPTAR